MSDWDYHYRLPPDLIAQSPSSPRDSSRLLVIDKKTGRLSHYVFSDLPRLLHPADVLVFNQTKVIPARLFGTKSTGGKIEILLLKQLASATWEVISHPGLRPSQIIDFSKGLSAIVQSPNQIKFQVENFKIKIPELLHRIGVTPLPPYIKSDVSESRLRRQYQTIYARDPGSAAAPTAGLHFTQKLLYELRTMNYELEFLTLHVGLGTFKSPTPAQIAAGHLHSEWFNLNSLTCRNLNSAKKAGQRIVAVGTTSARVLETCSDSSGLLHPRTGFTDIFIRPGYKFKFVDGLITNFHLPQTSLLMLISALASEKIIRRAYTVAVAKKYRFYSFGDACLII